MNIEQATDRVEDMRASCALCEGDGRILTFARGIATVPCWLCEETGQGGKLPAARVGFLLRVLRDKPATGPIVIQPDAPALLAQRLVRRLQRDLLIDAGSEIKAWGSASAITEALADEIHQSAIDGTIGRGA